jgi:hypothetical protein
MTALRCLVAPETVATRFLRGSELAAHVSAGLATTASAQQIARGAGYRVDRAAQLLAEAHAAPVGRALLARDWTDQHSGRVIVSIERDPEPEEPVRRTRRPAPSADEILWELEDAASREGVFDSVAQTLGVKPASLRRRINRLGIVAKARRHFPRLGYLPTGRPPGFRSAVAA